MASLNKVPYDLKGGNTFPISIILSTLFHFFLIAFLLNQGLFHKSVKKDVFVNVKIVELPYGRGGALSGTAQGKSEAKEVEVKREKNTPPKVSLPSKKEDAQKGKSPIKNPTKEGEAVGLGGEGVAGLGGKGKGILLDAQDFPYEWYKARLEQALKANWKKPFLKRKTSASVHFTILENGGVKDLQIVKSSGNIDFDKSVLKAIYDSVPFPKFPPGYNSEILGVLYTFELEVE